MSNPNTIVGHNYTIVREGSKLVLTIDLAGKASISQSGMSDTTATSGGNKTFEELGLPKGMKLGFTAFTARQGPEAQLIKKQRQLAKLQLELGVRAVA